MLVTLFFVLTPGLVIATPGVCASPADAIAQLASALSQNDSVSALAVFDPKMPNYRTIEANISALVSQADILCAIDVLEDKDENDGKNVTPDGKTGLEMKVDWYIQLKSQVPSGPLERRRENVTLQMKIIGGKWKITGLSSLTILAPLNLL